LERIALAARAAVQNAAAQAAAAAVQAAAAQAAAARAAEPLAAAAATVGVPSQEIAARLDGLIGRLRSILDNSG
jgi:hypothetical protein